MENILKAKINPNNEVPVADFLQLFDEEIKIIMERKEALKRAFEKENIETIPGKVFNDRQHTLQSNGKPFQLRTIDEMTKRVLENINFHKHVLDEIRSGKRQKHK